MNGTAPTDSMPQQTDVHNDEIGLVLVTHGDLAAAFVAALQHIVGPLSNVVTVCIGPDAEAALDALAALVAGGFES